MKKLYSLLVFGFAGMLLNTASAQCIVDPNNSTEGATPDPLPAACANEMYDQDVQLRFKIDTAFNYEAAPGYFIPVTAYAESIEILSIDGLPQGMDHDCPDNCIYTPQGTSGYENSCLNLSGTPTTEETGTATINLKVTVQIQNGGGTETIEQTMEVDFTVGAEGSCIPTAISESIETGFSVSPNPVTSTSSLKVSLASSGVTELKVYDVLGSEITSSNLGVIEAGTHSLSADFISTLSSGMYIIKLFKDGNETSDIQRIIIE